MTRASLTLIAFKKADNLLDVINSRAKSGRTPLEVSFMAHSEDDDNGQVPAKRMRSDCGRSVLRSCRATISPSIFCCDMRLPQVPSLSFGTFGPFSFYIPRRFTTFH